MNRIINDLKTIKRLFNRYVEEAIIRKQAKDVAYIYDSIFEKKTKDEILKNANFIQKNGFYFGNNPDMTMSDLRFLVKTLGTR